jgi:hypothetical protein
MSDQAFDMFGNQVAPVLGVVRTDPAGEKSSRFLARFGVVLFWVLAITIVSARVFFRV